MATTSKVTILANDEGGVRLAVDAPKEITILREELLNAMRVNRTPQPRKLRRRLCWRLCLQLAAHSEE